MNPDQQGAEDARPLPISVDELLDARHLATSLVNTWNLRFDQEQALQRVWPVPELAPNGAKPLLKAASSKRPDGKAGRRRRKKRKRAGSADEDSEEEEAEREQERGGWNGDSGDGLTSEDEERWKPWLPFLAARSEEWQDEDQGKEAAEEGEEGQLRARVSAALQTAEGLGWEEVAGEEDVQAVVAARLAWEGGNLPQPLLADLGLDGDLDSGLDPRQGAATAAAAAAAAAAAVGEEQQMEAEGAEEEKGGPSELAEEIGAVLQSIGDTMTAQHGQRRQQDPQLRRKLRQVQQSALAKATTRLELAVAAGAEYEAARLQLLRQRQRQRQPQPQHPVTLGEGLAGGRARSGPASATDARAGGRGLEGATGAAASQGQSQQQQQLQQARGRGTQQQQQQQQQQAQQQAIERGRQQQAAGRAGTISGRCLRPVEEDEQEGKESLEEQPLGFSDAVARLRSILSRTGLLEGSESQAGKQLLEQLLWLPGGPWTEGSMGRLEAVLGDAELLESVGEELRQSERQQRQWAPRQQRRPVSAAAPPASQLQVLRARLLPMILPEAGSGSGGAGNKAGAGPVRCTAEGAGRPPASQEAEAPSPLQAWVGTQHSVMGLGGSPRSQRRAGARRGRRQQQQRISEEEEEEGVGVGTVVGRAVVHQQQQQQRAVPGGEATREGPEPSTEAVEGEALHEQRLEAATQAGMGVLWGALDWALRCGAALTAVDMVKDTLQKRALKSRRAKATAAALARPTLPPLPLPSSAHAASLLLDPSQGPPAREGLPPAVAARLRSAAASGTATLTFVGPPSPEQGAAAAGAEGHAPADPTAALPAVVCDWEREPASRVAFGGAESQHGGQGFEGEEGGGQASGEAFWQQPSSSFYPPPHPVLARGPGDGSRQEHRAEAQPMWGPCLALDPQRLPGRDAVTAFWAGGPNGRQMIRSRMPVLLARAAAELQQWEQQQREREEREGITNKRRAMAAQQQQQQEKEQRKRKQQQQQQAGAAGQEHSAEGIAQQAHRVEGFAGPSKRSSLGSVSSAFQAWEGAQKGGGSLLNRGPQGEEGTLEQTQGQSTAAASVPQAPDDGVLPAEPVAAAAGPAGAPPAIARGSAAGSAPAPGNPQALQREVAPPAVAAGAAAGQAPAPAASSPEEALQRVAAPPAAAAAAAAEALQKELAQLPLDVQIAFESGLAMGLRPEIVAAALKRYHSIVNTPC